MNRVPSTVRSPLRFAVLALLAVSAQAAEEELRLDGRVRGSDGAALAKAEVLLRPLIAPLEIGHRQLAGAALEKPVVRTRSAADGRFAVAAPQAGGWKVEVRHPDHATMTLNLRALVESQELPPLELLPRSEVRIRLIDETGAPLAGVPVAARGRPGRNLGQSRSAWWPGTEHATTDEAGWAVLPAPGGTRVAVAAVDGERYFHRWLEAGDGGEQRLDGSFDTHWLLDADDRPVGGVVGLYTEPVLAIQASGDDGRIGIPQGAGDEPFRLVDRHGVYDELDIERRTVDGEERVYLRLPAIERIDGQVVDAIANRPVGGALVVTQVGAQVADGSGSFTMWTARAARPWLQVSAPGYLRNWVRARADGEPLTVSLTPAAERTGRVVDAAGGAIGGAEIRAEPASSSPYPMPRSHRTDETAIETISESDGRFRLRGLRADVGYRLEVERAGFAVQEVTVPATGSGVTEELEIVLEAGLRAFGRVLDVDEKPIAGARAALVAATDLGWPGRLAEPSVEDAVSDSEGRFELADLAPGTYSLRVAADGFASLTVPGIELTASAGPLDLGEVLLDHGVTLRGRVVDREGRPLAEATIRVHADTRGVDPPVTASSGSDGRFVLEHLPRAASMNVGASLDGYQAAFLAHVKAEDGPIELALERAAELAGRVLDERGEAVSRATVWAVAVSGGRSQASSTDGDGRFSLKTLQPGKVRVGARSAFGNSSPIEVDVVAGEVTELELVLESGMSLTGVLLDPDGAPVAAGTISLVRHVENPHRSGQVDFYSSFGDAQSDVQGAFAVAGLQAGRYQISAKHPGFEPIEQLIDVGEVAPAVELRFERRRDRDRLRVAGHVVDEAGAGIGGARIWLVTSLAGGGQEEQAVTFADGRFELVAAKAGTYTLAVQHSDFAGRRSAPFTVGEKAVEGLRIALDRGGDVVGEIRGLEFGELARLQITAVAQDMPRTAIVSHDGTYRISGLAPGTWYVSASVGGERSRSAQAVISGRGDQARVDFDFAGGLTVGGRVTVDGEPLAQASVYLGCGTRTASAIADSGGSFVLRDLEPGPCQLIVSSPRGIAEQREVEIAEGVVLDIELRSTSVAGRVVGNDGRPLAGAEVLLVGARGMAVGAGTTVTGPDGTFVLEGVAGGERVLRVTATGWAVTEIAVAATAAGVEVVLAPAQPLRLLLVHPSGVVPGVTVAASPAGTSLHRSHQRRYVPDAEGRIVLESLGPGAWQVVVVSDDGHYGLIEVQVPGPEVRVELSPQIPGGLLDQG